MKYVFSLFILVIFTAAAHPQPPKASAGNKSTSAPKKTSASPVKKGEKAELEKASAIEDTEQKATALAKFLVDFPKSESRPQVIESLTAARISAAQSKLEAGDRDGALKLVRNALDEAPVPYPEKLFADSISKIPMLMFSLGGAVAAYESAAAIEKNVGTTAGQLLSLAGFYLNMENGSEAKRIAEAALKADEKSAAAYQLLGMANRLNFEPEASAAAYEKAAELDPESVSARQNLAEMKRAIGKPEEAVTIFSTLIEKDANDLRSINGRILSLFDAGKRADAEAEFAKVIEADPGNLILLSGAAYWYAANSEHLKAVDLAGKAIAVEPRYIWSHIALARGLAGGGRFTDAEQVLLKAKKYGNFPTLDYELASVKFNAGFYLEAVEELQKSFMVRDGSIVTKLGRRIERSDKNFVDLLSAERRAGIMEPKAADSIETAQKMKALLEFAAVLAEKSPNETKAAESAAAFADGTDKMRFHRQLFAADQLAERSIAAAKVLELTKAAIASMDDGLSIPIPAAPIMAAELYASRNAAVAAGKYVLVPEVAKQTLSAIARGRIEELAATALLQQKNNPDAIVRLRRAVSILPEKSAWWRSSHWRLGTVLEAEGKDKEALDSYVKSYTSAEPEAEKYAVIERVYKRLNSGTDGLETLIGANPVMPGDKKSEPVATGAAETKAEAKADPLTDVKVDPTTEKKVETADSKPETIVVSPPKENEIPKISEPPPAAEVKKIAEEKAPGQKSADEPAKPVETNLKAEETKSKPSEAQPPKPEEKKVESTSEAKVAAIEETKTKTSKVEEAPPEVKVQETKAEEIRTEAKTPESKPTPKPLFEPVVIEVKSSKPAKTSNAAAESGTQTSATNGESSGASRARVVEGKEVAVDGPQCALSVSQSNISLISGKGSVGILVGADNGDIKDVKYSSSSPKDIEVAPDPALTAVNGQTLFVIRSLTEAVGAYQVSFASPCGKKDVQVRVR